MQHLIDKLKNKLGKKSTATTLHGLMAAARSHNFVRLLPNGGVAWRHLIVPTPPWYRRPVQRRMKQARRQFTQDERDLRRAADDPKFRKKMQRKATAALRKAIANLTEKDWYVGPNLIHLTQQCKQFGVKKIPIPDEQCIAAVKGRELQIIARDLANEAVELGGHYSGETRWSTRCGLGSSFAETEVCVGSAYPGKRFKKNNATHIVYIGYDDLQLVRKLPRHVMEACASAGLPIIGVRSVGRNIAEVLWAASRTHNGSSKSILSHTGCIAWEGSEVFHANTEKAALVGLRERLEARAGREAEKIRAQTGMAPLYGFTVRLEDIRRLTGWCLPGCRQWLRHYMGNVRTTAPWADVADAARRDNTMYGDRLLSLLGAGRKAPIPCSHHQMQATN